jgi:nitroreductase/FMN reductase [NAD(P)H]
MGDLAKLLKDRFGLDAGPLPDVAVNQTQATLLGHRTIRKYADKPVDPALLRMLLACAQSAPAKSDLQQYSIIHVADAAAKAKLAELAKTAPIKTAPVVLVFCGDIHRAKRIAELRGRPYGQDTLDSFMNAAADAALALQAFIVAAESAGLGCCAVSHVRVRIEQVAALLGLPDGVFPLAGLMVGWPDEERSVTARLPPAVVIHENKYDDKNLAAEIDGYDARRHAAFPILPRAQLFNDLYGVVDFYGWSEHAARRLSQPEGREGLREYLEAKGFALK